MKRPPANSISGGRLRNVSEPPMLGVFTSSGWVTEASRRVTNGRMQGF